MAYFKYDIECMSIRQMKGRNVMIKVGIIGATGYAGGELVRLLTQHKEAKIVWYGSRSYIDQKYSSVYGNMFQIVDDKCMDDNMEELAKQVDVIFTATPQGLCASLVNDDILSKVKIVDLSADFRIKDVSVYEKWYGIEHKSPQYIEEAVYGLCEINREDVKKARLVANPGCYTTCSILTAYPLVKEGLIDLSTLIVDAKSGTSGAGRGAKVNNLYCEVNENIKAYGVASHRHTPEIEEQLGYAAGEEITINFTPHLVPMNRGILATEYAKLKRKSDGSLPTYEEIKAVYDKYYKEETLDVVDKDIYQIYYDLENNLIQLWDDLRTKKYRILPSTVFVVEKPVKREIFAANFRDRIVHHLLLMYLNPYFEKYFIYDSYSCRVGKGTHFGIKRVNHFIHKCSENSKSKCWILKLDVQSFFMSIDKRILYISFLS